MTNTTNQEKSETRLAAVKALYAQAMNHDLTANQAVTDILTYYHQVPHDILPNPDSLRGLVSGTREHAENLDLLITKHLAQGWKLDRLDNVIRIILEAACFELAHYRDIDTSIILNDYIDITKCFGQDKDAQFVNGILDNIAKDLRPMEQEQ